jgi:type I restriction enzyme, S subunit
MSKHTRTKRLNDLASLRTEKVLGAKDQNKPYVGLEHMESGQPFLLGTAKSDSSISTNAVFYKGDVLFGKLRPNLRKSWLALFDGYCSTDILVLQPNEGFSPDFVARVFQREEVFEEAIRTAEGTKMPRTSWARLKEYEVFVPELDSERTAIAGIFNAADEAIAKTETLIAKLKAIRQGFLHDLLTRGLDENGQLRNPERHPEQFKESPLGLIPRDWTVIPLSDLADVDRGKFMHRPRNDPRFYGGEHPFVQTGDVAAADGRVLNTFSQTLNDRGASVSQEFPEGTIAITIAANIADTAILGRPMYFPDSIVGAIVKLPNVIRYFELWIRYRRNWLNAQAPQSAQKNINLETLRPLLIPVPNPDEQHEIAKIYDLLDSRIQSEEAYLSKLKAIKKGLMQDLLTGRLRITKEMCEMEGLSCH